MRMSGESTRERPRVRVARLMVRAAPPKKSNLALTLALGFNKSSVRAMIAAPRGILIQNIHCQLRYLTNSPPQSGPTTPPASADAQSRPRGSPLFSDANRSPTMAIETGTRAPAPMAWNTLDAIRTVRSLDMATKEEPSMNSSMDRT